MDRLMERRDRAADARARLSPATLAASPLQRYRALIDDWEAFADALARPLPTCIWANPTRIRVADLQALLRDEGLDAVAVPGLPDALRLDAAVSPGRHWWYCVGLAHAQELVSQLPAHLLGLSPGQRIWDMCAAPGGKTAQMAFALGNRGTLIANDVIYERIKALQGNLDRLGVLNVSTTCCDATRWPSGGGQFDRILLDAPCSSEGTLRRTPRLLDRLGPEQTARQAPRQRALLRKAIQRCRPGGRILYSTCTFAPEENELVIADILAEVGDAVRLLPLEVPGWVTRPGITDWQDRQLPSALAAAVRIWPHHNDTGGFFMALLEKSAATRAEPPAARAPGASPLDGTEDTAWLAGISDKYGLPGDFWDAYRVHRQTRRGLHLMAADHAPPVSPAPEGSGLFFHRTNLSPPKPTTSGAMLFGRAATRFRLELSRAQRDAYLRREPLEPTAAQRAAAQLGQHIVCYRGHVLGVAVWHRSGVIESLFPSRWSGQVSGAATQPLAD